MSKNHVAAPSTSISALALALVVALELTGVYALSKGPSQAEAVAVAAADGATVYAPARPRVASVEISIVAQADTPAR
jgi:hypothetical protein